MGHRLQYLVCSVVTLLCAYRLYADSWFRSVFCSYGAVSTNSMFYYNTTPPRLYSIDSDECLEEGEPEKRTAGQDHESEAVSASSDNVNYIIGDIVSINLISINGLDPATRFRIGAIRARAWYRVEVCVREAKGDVPNVKFLAFSTSTPSGLYEWMFFRGLTLKVELSRRSQAWHVLSSTIVHPYPPFTSKDIKVVYSNDRKNDSKAIMALFCKERGIRMYDKRPYMMIQYSDGTIVLAQSGKILVSSEFAVEGWNGFADAKLYIDISAATADARLYWHHSWVAAAKSNPTDEPYAVFIEQ